MIHQPRANSLLVVGHIEDREQLVIDLTWSRRAVGPRSDEPEGDACATTPGRAKPLTGRRAPGDHSAVRKGDLTGKALKVAADVFRKKGFEWITPQTRMPSATFSSLEFLTELIEPRERRPLVRVFKVRGQSPLPEELEAARSAARTVSIPLVALTEDGRKFKTLLATGNGGSLPYLPGAPDAVSPTAPRLEDTFPFTSILELRRVVARVADSLFAASGGDRLQLFDTTLTLLAIKFYDEFRYPSRLHLPAILRTSRPESALRAVCRKALQYFGVGEFMPAVDFSDAAVIDALRALRPYSLLQTIQLGSEVEVLSTFYQDIVSSTFRGTLGAYFTPKPIADLAVALCDPKPTDTIFDISCGSSTFLLSAYSLARAGIRDEKDAGPQLYGCDIQARMVLTSILNCFVHGVRSPHIIHGDALRLDLANWRHRDRAVPSEGFSLIVGNPPFAGFDVQAPPEAGREARGRTAGARIHKVIPFIDRVFQFLAPGGRAALVIPTSVLNGEAASFRGLRERLAQKAHVSAVVGLPKEAFVHTDCGVEGALLFFQKPTGTKPRSRQYTYFTRIESVGYDRRGRPTAGSDLARVVEDWRRRDVTRPHWTRTDELSELDRWDPAWLEAHLHDALRFNEETHLHLTDLCEVVERSFSRRTIAPDGKYTYFEVGDSELDTGKIVRLRRCSGSEILQKGRLRLRLNGNEVLLPNHRDSLIAKTASGFGRSAVLVPEELAGTITSDRFTTLTSKIDRRVLVLVLNSASVRQQLILRARGSASFDIRDKVLDDVWVPREIVSDPKLTGRAIELWTRREDLLSRLQMVSTEIQRVIH